MDPITLTKAPMTDAQKASFAIEVAFNALVAEATKLGLHLTPGARLVYLPHQEVTRQFIDAGRAVLAELSLDHQDNARFDDDGAPHPDAAG